MLLSVAPAASAQTTAMSCCAKPAAATEAFALLASNTDFSGGHDAPLPYSYAGEGSPVTFKTADAHTTAVAYLRKNFKLKA